MTERAALVTLLVAHVAGCSGPQAATGQSDDAGGQPSAQPPGAEASALGGSTEDAAPPQVFLRVAQLSPDLPAIDICVAPHGTTSFQGPLVAQLAASQAGPDAAAAGLGYAELSAYLALAPGQYDVRLVAAAAPDCSSALPVAPPVAAQAGADGSPPDAASDAGAVDADTDGAVGAMGGVLPDVTDLAFLQQGTYTTLLVAGEVLPTNARSLVVAAIDDDSALTSGAASLRAVNAMPRAPWLDFGLGSSATEWTALLTHVGFSSASTHAAPSAGAVDANGYLPVAPLSHQTLSARVSSGGAGDVALASAVTFELGAITTVIAVGRSGDAQHPPTLLLCTDNSPSGSFLSDCSIEK